MRPFVFPLIRRCAPDEGIPLFYKNTSNMYKCQNPSPEIPPKSCEKLARIFVNSFPLNN